MNTVEQLNKLAELRASVDVIDDEKQALIDSVYTEEIRQKVKEIEAEFAPKVAGLNKNISDTESAIKAEVIQSGETAQGDTLEAVFTGGRTSWDTKGLDEAIKVIPTLAQYRKIGDPYVTIRARKVAK
jgi:phage host-nuclease inhibitor protein Gam